MSTVLEFLIFLIISKLTGIPVTEINGQTIIPRRQQENIVTQVIASTGVYLPFSSKTKLTVGQIVEEVKNTLAKKPK